MISRRSRRRRSRRSTRSSSIPTQGLPSAGRLALDFSRHATHFRVACKTTSYRRLRKGVPSLFADIKPLYKDPTRSKVFGDIFEDWLKCLEESGTLRGERSKRCRLLSCG